MSDYMKGFRRYVEPFMKGKIMTRAEMVFVIGFADYLDENHPDLEQAAEAMAEALGEFVPSPHETFTATNEYTKKIEKASLALHAYRKLKGDTK